MYMIFEELFQKYRISPRNLKQKFDDFLILAWGDFKGIAFMKFTLPPLATLSISETANSPTLIQPLLQLKYLFPKGEFP